MLLKIYCEHEHFVGKELRGLLRNINDPPAQTEWRLGVEEKKYGDPVPFFGIWFMIRRICVWLGKMRAIRRLSDKRIKKIRRAWISKSDNNKEVNVIKYYVRADEENFLVLDLGNSVTGDGQFYRNLSKRMIALFWHAKSPIKVEIELKREGTRAAFEKVFSIGQPKAIWFFSGNEKGAEKITTEEAVEMLIDYVKKAQKFVVEAKYLESTYTGGLSNYKNFMPIWNETKFGGLLRGLGFKE